MIAEIVLDLVQTYLTRGAFVPANTWCKNTNELTELKRQRGELCNIYITINGGRM